MVGLARSVATGEPMKAGSGSICRDKIAMKECAVEFGVERGDGTRDSLPLRWGEYGNERQCGEKAC